MKNKYPFWLLALVVIGLASDSVAAPTKKTAPKNSYASSNSSNDVIADEVLKENRFYLFGGIDLGLALYSQSDVLNDASRSGIDIGARGLLAYYTKKWVFDGGLGFAFLSSSGTNTSGRNLSVTTRTAYLDFSPRYRFATHWQVGPEFQYWLGTDNGLNGDLSSTSNKAVMGGLQLLREWGDESTKYRIGGRWNIDFNAADRNLNVFQLFFQIGFSPFGGEPVRSPYIEEMKEDDVEKVEAEPAPTPRPEPSPEPIPEPEVMSTPAPVEEVAPLPIGPQEKMVITLDVRDLPFESDSAKLPKYNRDRVQEIGRFLGERKEDWNSLIVSGHTDEQGKKAYNIKLSKARADTVRQLLGEGGAPLNKIKAVGMGSSRPIDRKHNKKAWAKNRRVELEFKGVKDGLVIQKAFKR
jgi:outer membrane protein OmpA-like peptidoglycan-associated protein